MRLKTYSGRAGVFILLAIIAMMASISFFGWGLREPTFKLRLSAGDRMGRRFQLAELLQRLAAERGLKLDLVASEGSDQMLDMLDEGTLDLALVQGGLSTRQHVQLVAPLVIEPLHLLSRQPLDHLGAAPFHPELKINLGPEGSGTRQLALEVLEFTGHRPGVDFLPCDFHSDELLQLPTDQLPDLVFVVGTLPSPQVFALISREYQLVPMPYAEAMGLVDIAIESTSIPAFTYRAWPPIPSESLETVGVMLQLVARDRAPDEAVTRLLEVIYEGPFAREAALNLDQVSSDRVPEFPFHAGALTYRNRNVPLVTGELIENIENLRSFLVSGAIALILIWQWYRRRPNHDFDQYLVQISNIEEEWLQLDRADAENPTTMLDLRERLSDVKRAAIQAYAAGQVRDAQLLAVFLLHVVDVGNQLRSPTSQTFDAARRMDPTHFDDAD